MTPHPLPSPHEPPAMPPPVSHVLVVEDDALNRSIVCSMLRHAGYRVSAAEDGHDALHLMRELDDVDVVLMDWQLPDLDGLEVTRRMRAGASGPMGTTVAIVALTANDFPEDRAACLASGMNDFLAKPALLADLLGAVQRWAPASAR